MQQRWTTDDIPDLTGKIMIVTGANSGIGYEAAKELVRKGARTILACRNADKAQEAMAQILEEIPHALVEIMLLDLSQLSSIRSFSIAFQEKYDRLDVLLNNAGIMMVPYGKTVDGFERQLGTNHFGHFALTGLLLRRLVQTPQARVVNVSSTGHRIGKMDFDNLMFEGGKGYSPTKAYGRSKLANLLFTYELQRQFEAHQVDAIAVAAHPGGSDTNLGAHLYENWAFRFLMPLFRMMTQSAAMGALPSLRAAVDPEVEGGQYFGPKGFQEIKGFPVVVRSNKASHSIEDAQRLWDISEQLTGVEFSWPTAS